MPGNEFVIVMLFLWTFVGRGVNGKTVAGVLHGRVELQGLDGHGSNVNTVEWIKYTAGNSTTKLLYWFNMTNNASCSNPYQNISSDFKNKSLTFISLTKEDAGIYEATVVLENGTIRRINITLSVLFASSITVSSSPGSLTLKCETSGEFKLLQWFKNEDPLPDNQRFNLTENNKTMQVSNPSSSDCGMYTCQVSNENGNSMAQVSIDDKIPNVCLENTSGFSFLTGHVLFPAGFSLIGLLILCIILIYIFKYYARRKINTSASTEEPIYNEPMFLQEETATPTMDPLIVYQDFIKPKDFHQSEDHGYSTITDVLDSIELPKIST